MQCSKPYSYTHLANTHFQERFLIITISVIYRIGADSDVLNRSQQIGKGKYCEGKPGFVSRNKLRHKKETLPMIFLYIYNVYVCTKQYMMAPEYTGPRKG